MQRERKEKSHKPVTVTSTWTTVCPVTCTVETTVCGTVTVSYLVTTCTTLVTTVCNTTFVTGFVTVLVETPTLALTSVRVESWTAQTPIPGTEVGKTGPPGLMVTEMVGSVLLNPTPAVAETPGTDTLTPGSEPTLPLRDEAGSGAYLYPPL
jgi:hypothetical protein